MYIYIINRLYLYFFTIREKLTKMNVNPDNIKGYNMKNDMKE